MAKTPEQFVVLKYAGQGGNFYDSNYLGNYDTGKPHVFQDTLIKIYSSSSRFTSNKSLLGIKFTLCHVIVI